MQPRFIYSASFAISLLCCAGLLPANDKAPLDAIQKALSKKILQPGQALQEMQAYCRTGLVPLPQPKSIAEWEKYAANLRRQIFDNVVYRGEAAKWKEIPTEPVWLDTIPGGPGYSIRKLRYEAVPGMWIPALLYMPDKLSGKVPVVMAVNGHERTGKATDYKQVRCINLAKRGMIVLNVEWLNMGQLRSSDFHHGRMNQLDLCGTSGLAPFYLSMKRGLDILLAHPNADPKRVAVSGLSGGGWQTIIISALDTRVTLCNPVAGYSGFATRIDHAKDLGDSEQTPVDLGKYADYTHLTALLAPRPALLTYNAKDDCCFEAGYALPPLLQAAEPIYKLYGKSQNLRFHINYNPGTHNYLKENREAYYKLLGDFFYAGDKSFVYPEIACEKEIKTAAQLQVAVPEPNAGFNTLALRLAKDIKRDGILPDATQRDVQRRREKRKLLRELVNFNNSPASSASGGGQGSRIPSESIGGCKVEYETVVVSAARHPWHVPVVSFTPPQWKSSAIIFADQGRSSVADLVQTHLAAGEKVRVADLVGFGEQRIERHGYLFAMLVASHGQRPIGLAAAQALGLKPQSSEQDAAVTFVARGPRACAVALVLGALTAPPPRLELHDCPGSLNEVLEKNLPIEENPELFCFGLLEQFDNLQLAALCAPSPVTFVNPTDRVRKELAPLRDVYRAHGSNHDPLPKKK